MSDDLDPKIRSLLARVRDATPMPRPLSDLQPPRRVVGQRRVLSIAVAAIVAVGIAGIVVTSVRRDSPGTISPVDTPATTSTPMDSTSVPSTVPPQELNEQDAELLAVLYSLLNLATADESVTFLSTNIPEDDVARCMSDAGYPYVKGLSPDEQIAGSPSPNTMSAEEYAATYGLGITAWNLGLFPPGQGDPNLAYKSSLGEDERDEYSGTLAWCRGITPDRIGYTTALNAAVKSFRDRVSADDRVVAALASWRACMATKGLTFDSPQAMRESFYTRMDSGLNRDQLEELHGEEVDVAVSNVACERPLIVTNRTVVAERFVEFRELLDAASSEPGG